MLRRLKSRGYRLDDFRPYNPQASLRLACSRPSDSGEDVKVKGEQKVGRVGKRTGYHQFKCYNHLDKNAHIKIQKDREPTIQVK